MGRSRQMHGTFPVYMVGGWKNPPGRALGEAGARRPRGQNGYNGHGERSAVGECGNSARSMMPASRLMLRNSLQACPELEAKLPSTPRGCRQRRLNFELLFSGM